MPETSPAAAKRRVLMLCYYFPPIQATGVTRSRSFAENLPALGWDPIVLTVANCRDPWVKLGTDQAPDVRIERSSEWNLARLADLSHAVMVRIARLFKVELKWNYIRDLLCIPDTQIAWFSTLPGIRLAREADLVYVSCSPFSSAMSGVLIKFATGKPLIIDFRDAWTLNPHTKLSCFHRAVIGVIEHIVIRQADKFVVNTEGAAKLYREKYPHYAAKIVAIPNGYDELTPVKQTPDPQGPFKIMHVGSFYGSRSPERLFEALVGMPDIDLEFVQVGSDFDAISKYKERIKTTVTKPVPRAKALELMTTASLLYLKQGWEPGVKDYIAVAAKTYEYIATGLPILAEVPPGDNADIVKQYSKNSYVITDDDVNQLRAAISSAYRSRASVKPEISEAFKAKFDRKQLTAELVQLFEQCLVS